MGVGHESSHGSAAVERVPSGSKRFPFPLPNGWFQVAYSDELRAGELLPLHYFGRDLIAIRGSAGEARVLDAYCPHLGAHLAHGGTVTDGRIRCPFHRWEFEGDGRCVHVPYAKRLPQKARIHSWPVVEHSGLVLMYFDKDLREPSYEIPEIPEYGDDAWTDYYRQEWTVKSCNQELAENTVDPAHFRYVHGTAELPEAQAWTEGHLLRAKMEYPIAAGDQIAHGEIDIYAHGPGIGVTYFHGIIETTVVVSGTPIDDETVHQRLSFMVPHRESAEATEGLARVFVGEISKQFQEDIAVWENKAYWASPVLCDGDGPIATVRGWAQQFY
jgi:3-ketosteroid 9alpha-monooxygenase subunit A